MTIRPEVQELADLGPFPASADAQEADVDRRGALLMKIVPPVTRDEAVALLSCFGPDEAFGLAWTLLHLIETGPRDFPLVSNPEATENEWVRRLRERRHR